MARQASVAARHREDRVHPAYANSQPADVAARDDIQNSFEIGVRRNMTTDTRSMDERLLPEDPIERRMFDDQARLHGDPLLAIAQAMVVWSKMNPAQGSLSKTQAIYANEMVKAAALRRTQSEAVRTEGVDADIRRSETCRDVAHEIVNSIAPLTCEIAFGEGRGGCEHSKRCQWVASVIEGHFLRLAASLPQHAQSGDSQ